MVNYNFHARFVPPIAAGIKIHTIRRSRTGRSRHARVGDPMTLQYGSRYQPKRLLTTTCIWSSGITLDLRREIAIATDGDGACIDVWEGAEFALFARQDGFESPEEMRRYWWGEHRLTRFEGWFGKWAAPAGFEVLR